MSLVVKIMAQRANAGGTISYLASNAKLHCDQRIVAGSVQYPGHLDKQMVKQVAADLEFNQQVTGKVVPKGHIYHVSLSASADNGQLSDARWGAIANDFMTGMKFTGPNLSPVRWTAINHGPNAAGADHIHIAMSLVRQNGRQVSLHNDMVRASALATKLEQKYALGVLETRLALVGAGSVPYTYREARVESEQQRPEPQRVTLEREIRALAAEARTEAGFVSLVKSSGILLAPYPRESGMVTGYSVALPAVEGYKPEWFGGGRLAKDLTLPQLRRRWPLNQAASQYAWRGKIDADAEPETETVTVEQAGASLNELGETIAEADPAQFADASHDLAGLLAAASRALEETPGELAAASREVGAWAQPTVMPLDAPVLTRAGARLFVLGLDPSGPRGRSIMFRQFAETIFELYRLHQVQRLRAATRRQVGRVADDANPASEVIEDGTTLVATGSMLGVMQHAQSKQRTVSTGDDGAMDSGGSDVKILDRIKAAGNDPDLWDRDTFRDTRQLERARREQIREHARQIGIGPKPELEQIQKLQALAAHVGLPLDRETIAAVRADRVEQMILDFELAAKDYGLGPLPTGTREEVVATKLVTHGGASTGSEADVFLAQLERRAELREEARAMAADVERRNSEAPWVDPDTMVELDRNVHAAGIHPVSIEQAQPGEQQASWRSNPKDPRTWDNALEPVSPKQQFRLIEAGFSAPEIQSLAGKGEASVVVGAYLGPDGKQPPNSVAARKAYDLVQSDAIAAASGLDVVKPVKVAEVPSLANTPKARPTVKPVIKPLRPQQ